MGEKAAVALPEEQEAEPDASLSPRQTSVRGNTRGVVFKQEP